MVLRDANGRGAAGISEVISLPGINLDLISITEGGQTLLQPTRDLPKAQLFQGRPVKAEEALAAIGRYVKELDAKFGEEIRRRRLVN